VCVATNVADGREVVLRTGPLHRAILASAAIPLVLQPVEWGDLRLIDGGLSNNLPVDRARELGADLVIAVDASEPLLPPEQIDSLAAVAEQVVSFPVVAGRDRQAPQADVLIVLGLGEHGNAEFSSSLAIMEAGRRFVTEGADLLRPLAEVCKLPAPADAGGRNRAGAPGAGESARPPGQGPVIDEVRIEGGRRLRPEVLEEWVRVPIGAPLEAKALEEQIEAVYATGYFDAVEPSIETLPDGRHRLRLHLREKRALQVGVGLRYEDERGPAMLVTLGRFNFLGRDNGAYLDARWGTVSRLDLHYLQPSFPATSFFTSLRLSGVDDFRFVYGPRERRDRYMDRRLALDLAAGNTVRALGELSLAYRLERINFQPEEKGEPGLAGSEFSRLGMLSLRTRVDTLDDASIPTRGRRLRFALDAARDGLGSEVRFNRARFEIAAVRGLGPGSAHLGLQLGTAFGGSLPQSEKLLLGGPQSLHGLHRAERRGDEMFAARAGWRAPLGTLPWMGGGRYYLGGVVDLGSAASERRELGRGSVLGAGVEFSADTRIGPLQVAFGQSEGGAETAYFSLGFPF
jgi:NTE family protein